MFHVKHSVIEVNVSRETLDKVDQLYRLSTDQLSQYARLLTAWNKKINLLSREITEEMIILHIHHSLMVLYADIMNGDSIDRIIDAGSGGGLPGIPLGIVLENEVQLVDVVEKKILAANQMCRTLGLKNVRGFHQSIAEIETTARDVYVSKHAFKLGDFFELVRKGDCRRAVFLKGETFSDELELCNIPLDITYVDLYKYHNDMFYKGKMVLSIQVK